jgi:diguanylate cyclase (GGDEF)-like protein
MPAESFSRAELERLELFAAADLAALEPLLHSCAVRALASGEVLIEAGQQNRHLHLVLSGALSVHLESPDARAITLLRAGSTAGEISLIDGEPASAYVIADGPTRVLVIDEELLWLLADSSHAVAYNLLRTLASRLRGGNDIIQRNLEQLETYRFQATVDALTGLFNRYWLHKMLARQMERSRGGSEALSLLLVDVDHFKRFNDEHGHVAGDYALRAVAACLRGALRPTDMIARYGGEEFAVLLPGARAEQAREVAERLRRAVADMEIKAFDGRKLPRVTVSIGVAQMSAPENGAGRASDIASAVTQVLADSFIEQADQALYRAKDAGRDRVEL